MFDQDKTGPMSTVQTPTHSEVSIKPKFQVKVNKTKTVTVLDEAKSKLLFQQIRDNQNLSMGIVGGIGGAIVGAVIWALVTALTNYQIGFMAIGIGFLVGYAVRKLGQGIDPTFGYVGAAFAFLGCVVGNLLTTCIIVSQQESVPLGQVLSSLNFSVAIEIMKFTFSPIDVLFYGLALYYGYKFSFRQLTPEEVKSVAKPANA